MGTLEGGLELAVETFTSPFVGCSRLSLSDGLCKFLTRIMPRIWQES